MIDFSDKDWQTLAGSVEMYLKEHKEVDLRVYMEKFPSVGRADHNDVNKVANIIRASGKYLLVPIGLGDTNSFIISNKGWAERNPTKDKWRTGFITFLFSLTAALILFLLQDRKQGQADTLQNKRLDSLKSSIDNFQKHLTDTAATLRADTNLKKR